MIVGKHEMKGAPTGAEGWSGVSQRYIPSRWVPSCFWYSTVKMKHFLVRSLHSSTKYPVFIYRANFRQVPPNMVEQGLLCAV